MTPTSQGNSRASIKPGDTPLKRLALAILFFTAAGICHGTTEEQYRLYEEMSGWVRDLFPLDFPSTQAKILGMAEDAEIIEGGLVSGPSGADLYNRTFVFDGLELAALVSPKPDGAAYIYHIKITSPRWRLSNGISVGSPAAALEAIAYPASDGENRYCGVADQCVEFEIGDGKVQSILIQLYIG